MYAVIKAGGKQQRVRPGDVIEVELMTTDDDTVTFQPLLVVDDEGAAHVGKDAAKAVVTAKPLGERKGDKVRVVRYRPKTGYMRRGGHRQMRTLLEIQEVKLGGSRRRTPKAEPPADRQAAEQEGAKSTGAEPKGVSEGE